MRHSLSRSPRFKLKRSRALASRERPGASKRRSGGGAYRDDRYPDRVRGSFPSPGEREMSHGVVVWQVKGETSTNVLVPQNALPYELLTDHK